MDGEGHFYLKNGTYLGQAAGADHKATDRKATDRPREGASDFAAAKGGGDVEAKVVPVQPRAAAKASPTPAATPAPASFAAAKLAPSGLVEDAIKLLRRLELKKPEAEGLVGVALAAEPWREWSLEDLVGEALRAMPTAHLAG